MRALFACLPFTGHFLPLVPLAQALQESGHEVAFATSAHFVPSVAAAGFRALPAGMDSAEWSRATREVPPPDQWPSRGKWLRAVGAQVFAGSVARRLAQDLLEVHHEWRADIVIHEDTAIGAAVAAERLGIPHARLIIMAAGPGHETYAQIDPPIAALRAEHGLDPGSADTTLHRYAVLYPFPPSLLAPGKPIPATFQPIRPVLPAPAPRAALPDWLDRLGSTGRPVVYATLGTLFNGRGNDAVFSAIGEALAGEGIDVVLTVGANRDLGDFGALAPNVRVANYIPLAALLDRCDAVISHGGSGTLVGALAHGLPQVILPFGADQFENAARIEALGAGLVVGKGQRTPEAIRAAVRTALDDPRYRYGALAVRREIVALPGPECAVELLEQLAAGSVPRVLA